MTVRQGSGSINNKHVFTYTWSGLANGDTGNPVDATVFTGDWLVQVTGTFGAAGNVIIQGRNDGTNYATLEDAQGDALATITAAGIYVIGSRASQIRPNVSAGDGTTALVVTFTARPTI